MFSRFFITRLCRHKPEAILILTVEESPMEKTKVVSVVSQKGGSGKSSTAIMLANYLAALGKSVLLTDTDYSNSTTLYYLTSKAGEKGFAESMKKRSITENIIPTRKENIDIVPSDKSIENIRVKDNRMLLQILETESAALSVYDYIVIDTSQGYNPITANAITASDLVLTPLMMCQFDLMSCLALRSKIIEECDKYGAWHLFFNGVSRYILNPNSGSYQYMSLYKKTFTNCLPVYIPRTTAVVNAIDRDMPVTRKTSEKLYDAIRSLAGIVIGEEAAEAGAF
jgi:chromosome partitioning protein